ncbi:MAG: Fe-S-containing protein [Candidatus Binataceae bacterium]
MRLLNYRTVLGAIAVAVLALVLIGPLSGPRCTLLRGADTLSVPLNSIIKGTASFFCYRDSAGENLRFVLARGVDGKVRSVFDACRQCYRYHKGFSASHGQIICRLCGNRYPIKRMMAGSASCAPVPLKIAIRGRRVTVKVSDVRKGQWLF